MNQTLTPTFDCTTCNEQHELPLSISFATPDFISKLLPWDREKRVKSSEDWCIVDDSMYYIRGCLELAVPEIGQTFSIGVWSSLSAEDFDRYMELWNDPARLQEPAYLGMIANDIPLYDNTRMLQTRVQTRAVGDRPLITVPDKHPLGKDQKHGISRARVIEFAQLVLHGHSSNPYGYLCER